MLVQLVCLAGMAPALAANPLRPRQYEWFPIADLRPTGWLRQQEAIQADTLGGHLQEFFVNGSQWVETDDPVASPFNQRKHLETLPYWLDGILPLATQLNNTHLKAIVHGIISVIIDRQNVDGWMGPHNISDVSTLSPWPRYRLLTVLRQYAQVSSQKSPTESYRAISAMHRCVRRLYTQLNETSVASMKSKFGWAHARWFELAENAQALIDLDPMDNFGDQSLLLDTMELVQSKGLAWDDWYTSRGCANASDTHCFPCR
jgi:hypothetical protein